MPAVNNNKPSAVAIGYKKQSKNGQRYIQITVKEDLKAGDKLTLFMNNEKKSEKSPDVRLLRSTAPARTEQAPARPAAPRQTPKSDNSYGDLF